MTWIAFEAQLKLSRNDDRTTFWNATHKKSHANINSAIKETQWHPHLFGVGKRSIFIFTGCFFMLQLLCFFFSFIQAIQFTRKRCAVSFALALCVCVSVVMFVSLKIETHSIVVAVWLSASLFFATKEWLGGSRHKIHAISAIARFERQSKCKGKHFGRSPALPLFASIFYAYQLKAPNTVQ